MAKFKIDDWVTIKGVSKDDRFHIVEIVTTECSGGIQDCYRGRHFFKNPRRVANQHARENTYFMSAIEMTMREIELGEVTEVI